MDWQIGWVGKVAGILIGGVGVVSSNPTGGNFIFLWTIFKPSMSILYRNARYVLKAKNSIEVTKQQIYK